MRGYSTIGLINPNKDSNIGGALRAAHCYGSSLILVEGKKYKKEPTDTSKAYRNIPLIHTNDIKDSLPFDCTPIAVEFIEGSTDLKTFIHPERALYIFGPETGDINLNILRWCAATIYIPTKICMNLAATVNVVLYDRMVKS